ncbi:hypothetical protein EZS27_011763 [termite gut metagenome]|uniref:Uncharacterized protein n=1 Tax=termite gut metagenome TaxID=433724 RepID=A0A5J4S2D3_9ZZZZ
MEEKEKISIQTIQDAPYYFSHYANMARHNAFLIVNEINEKVFQRSATKEDELLRESFLVKPPRQQADIIGKIDSLLLHHFPFLAYYENKSAGSARVELKKYMDILNQFRNEVTHYKHPVEPKCIVNLQEVFSSAVEKVQERMIAFSEKDFEHLKPSSSDYRHYILTEAGINTLTDTGLYFFLCLFLEKKYAYKFLAGIKGFKNNTDHTHKVALEVFTQFCCRLPYSKSASSDIALDMLNELNRCPKALYQVIDNEQKELFTVKKEDIVETEQGTEDVPEPVMIRYDDRFPYFALRYFDESEALTDISFQLYLGRKHKKELHRKKLNGEMRTHNLLKEMHVFGKLADYQTEEMTKSFIESKAVEHYAPGYRIVNNRIGVLLKAPEKCSLTSSIPQKTNTAPSAILSTHELAALYLYNRLYKQGSADNSPASIIKKYIENFNRFIKDLQSGKSQPVESGGFRRMRNSNRDEEERLKLQKAKQELQKQLDVYELKVSYLPDACLEYLLSYKKDNKEFMLKDTFRKMWKNADEGLEKIRKKEEQKKEVKQEKLAQELAQDFVYLTPPHKELSENGTEKSVDKKINNMEFDVLKNMLTYFPLYKNRLKPYLNILKDTENKWQHPFLHLVLIYDFDSCNSLKDFYVRYYEYKKIWINKFIQQDKRKRWNLVPKQNVNDLIKKYDYFLKTTVKFKSAKEKEYSKDAIFLPKGLFDAHIAEAMKKQNYEVKETDNAAYFLKVYFDGKSQNYYSLPRYYDASAVGWLTHEARDILKRKIEETWETKNDEEFRNKLKKLSKDIRESETELLHQQTNDRTLFLMVNDLLSGNTNNYKDIVDLGYNNKSENSILNKLYPIKETIHDKIVTAELPIKRYGEFKRFMKDRRLPDLLGYYGEKEIPLKVLETEMETYDRMRKDAIEQIYNFEKLIYDNFESELKKSVDPSALYIDHNHYLNFVKQKFKLETVITEMQSESFRELRNKIEHNQFPPREDWIIDKISQDTTTTIITEKIMNLISTEYKKIWREVESTTSISDME